MNANLAPLADGTIELISFRIGEQEFALDIMSVREIRGWTPATVLPHAPDFVRGVINLRGLVLPVLDLKARLGLGPTEANARSAIIVVRSQEKLLGLLVDAVSDILTAAGSSVQPVPNVGCGLVSSFVKGVIGLEGRMISYLNLDGVLPQGGGGDAP